MCPFWLWRGSVRTSRLAPFHKTAKGPRHMALIEIYTSPLCGYCHAAKRLLNDKGVSFAEIDVAADPKRRQEMMGRAKGRHTVPQIFIDDTHIGGYDDMAALDRTGKLDPLLAAE